MKKIEAYIRHEAFEPIRMDLLRLGFPSLSITEVKGSGRQKGITERYRAEHRFRLDVLPGMTGPMQVFGRGDLEFDERLAVEREYIENVSITRDVHILALTLPAAISRRGAL